MIVYHINGKSITESIPDGYIITKGPTNYSFSKWSNDAKKECCKEQQMLKCENRW
jgi:hypothetical protein